MKKIRKIGRFFEGRSESEASGSTQPQETSDALGPDIVYDGTTNPAGGVDIVFVHGLRGSSRKTWSSGEVCWPRDLLKHDIENSRVITWGYDSSVAKVFTYASVESIYGHAEAMLIDLSSIRRDITRPIIFAAHSLGGLVVKEALIKAAAYKSHGRHLDFAEIYAKTQGIIFFGTPHRGSGKESLGEIVAEVSKYCLRQPNKQLLRTLRSDSHILENQRDQFVTISQEIHVICVREALPTAIGIIVPESSACYDGFNVKRSSVNANHMDMVRFAHRGDSRYLRIIGHLIDLNKRTKTHDLDPTMGKAVLDKLYFQSLEYRELNIDPAYEKTFQWITSDEKPENPGNESTFITWLHSNAPLLWISGKAASGKSTLMKYLYQTQKSLIQRSLESSSSSQIIAAFFLYERGGNLQKSREGMLRSLLYQVLSADRTLIVETPMRALDWESLQWTFSQVLQVLEERRTKLFLFLDGLDEYRIIDRIDSYTEEDFDLMYDGENDDAAWGTSPWIVGGYHEIARFVKKLGTSEFVRICFSSREVPVFENQFRDLPRIRVHNHTRDDIYCVCHGRLSKEAPYLSDMELFAKAITTKASGVFLWVKLVIDMLIDGCINGDTPDELWEILNSVPGRLGGKNGLYMLMVRHILDDHKAESSKIFEIVLSANEPLHIAHLFKAAECLNDPNRGTPVSKVPDQQYYPMSLHEFEGHCDNKARRLKSRCAGLLEAEPEIQFMHQTAKEFMSRQYVWETIFGFARGKPSYIIPTALVRGSVEFIRMLDKVDLPQSFDSIWVPENRSLMSIRDVMDCLSEIDYYTEDIGAYVSLVKLFDETCQNSQNTLSDPFKTGAPKEIEFNSWIPPFTADVFSSWINVHTRVRNSSPQYFSDFNAYATQYDLAKYIKYELQSKTPVERVEIAQMLLASAFCVHNYQNETLVLLACERVTRVILSNGASPNKAMSRYSVRNNLNNAGREYTVWNDLVESGFMHRLGPMSTRSRHKMLFRPNNSATEFIPFPTDLQQLTWVGGTHVVDSIRLHSFLEWLRIVSLFIEHGARLDTPAGVLVKQPVSPSPTELECSEPVTVATILELILDERTGWETEAQIKDMMATVQNQIRQNTETLATEVDKSDLGR